MRFNDISYQRICLDCTSDKQNRLVISCDPTERYYIYTYDDCTTIGYSELFFNGKFIGKYQTGRRAMHGAELHYRRHVKQ